MVNTDDFRKSTPRNCFKQVHIAGADDAEGVPDTETLQRFRDLIADLDLIHQIGSPES